ncbi:MAG TPA: DNA alkylation repair protein [Candidatus Binatia bacterium]|nr:DNA alkylation repair protein [Candidatus Binatia bacterium]
MGAEQLKSELNDLFKPNAAAQTAQFFKAYDGGYSQHDKFLGIKVPVIRAICKNYSDLPLTEIAKLLKSPIHEHRFAGLVILTNRAKKAAAANKKALYDFYMAHIAGVNNWDLVDISCRDVIGGYLIDKSRQPLYKLAKSKNIWERRIAIVSTWEFIRQKDLADTFKISEMLMADTHDLIHKAVGWMLREAGKRDRAQLLKFLDAHAHELPRTTLRYSIEHLPPEQRQHYMALKSKTRVE